jgi:hypothetical protein
MKNKTYEWIMVTSKFLFLMIAALLIYWLVLKLTNHSPTAEQLLIGLQIMTITLLVGLMCKTFMHMGKVEQYMKESDRRFYALAKDFKRHTEQSR